MKLRVQTSDMYTPRAPSADQGIIKSQRSCTAVCVALGAIAVELLPPFHHVAFAAVFLDQPVNVIHAPAIALGAFDAKHVELAFNVAEDEVGPRH